MKPRGATGPDAGWRAHVLWTLMVELFFFAAVLAVAAALGENPAVLGSGAVRLFLRRLDQAFMPFGALHPWYRLAIAIFLHNARALLLVAFAAAVCAALAGASRARTLALAALAVTLAGVCLFWFVNVATAGLVVAAVARAAGVSPLTVWLTLLPHGVFELFALSWAMVLPARLAWTWLATESGAEAANDMRAALWPGIAGAIVVLALAATLEATVSPRLLHALVPRAEPTLTRTAARL